MSDESDDNTIEPNTAKIIALPSSRGEIERSEPEDPAACRHFGWRRLVNKKERAVRCEGCHSELDPIDCLMEIVDDREGHQRSKQHSKDDANRAHEELEGVKKALAAGKKKLRAEQKKGAVAEERKRMLDLTQGVLDRFCSDVQTESARDFANAEGMLFGISWVVRGLFAGAEYPELPGLLRRVDAGHQELDARRRRMNLRPVRGWDKRRTKTDPGTGSNGRWERIK